MNIRSKKQLLRMAKRRIPNSRTMNRRELVIAIRRMHPQAPEGGAYELFEWFCVRHKTISKAKRRRGRVVQASDPVASDAFLRTYEWRKLRMEVLVEQGRRCACCGATPANGVTLHVDHIKPRKRYPALALDKTNLQVLCEICNHGKGNWDETDWRQSQPTAPKPRLVRPVEDDVERDELDARYRYLIESESA